jgi:tRNA 2-thiouridine synthesizing protein C
MGAYPLIVLSRAPYDGSAARAALDFGMAFAVFDRAPRLLFTGDAIMQLLPDQDARPIGRGSLRKVIDSLPLYDVDTCYVDRVALAAHGIDESGLPAGMTMLDAAGLSALYAGAAHLYSL